MRRGRQRTTFFTGKSSIDRRNLPKNLPLNILVARSDISDDIKKIKQIPCDYFKIRVRHYEDFHATSFGDVLVNR